MTGLMQCSEQLHHLLKRCPGTGVRAAAVSSSHRGPHGRKVLQELQFSDREVGELEVAGLSRRASACRTQRRSCHYSASTSLNNSQLVPLNRIILSCRIEV
jgi:hypothetical protein